MSSSNWIKISVVLNCPDERSVNEKVIRFGSDDTTFEYDGMFFADLHNVFNRPLIDVNDFVNILTKMYPDEYVEIAQNGLADVELSDIRQVSIHEWIGDGSDILEAIEDEMDDYEMSWNAREMVAIYNPDWNMWCFERYIEVNGHEKRMYQEDSVEIGGNRR